MTADDNPGILIVEDDTAKLAQYAGMIADLGYPVVSAASIAEAMAQLEHRQVAVILAAHAHEAPSPREFAERVRRQAPSASVPILFLDSNAQDVSSLLADTRIGSVDLLEVPLQAERLRARVRIFLDLDSKTRQLAEQNADLDARIEGRMRERHSRETEDEIRTRAELLEMATEGIVVRSLRDGSIQYWNSGAEHVYGWNRDEASGRDIHELLQTVFADSRSAVEHELIARGVWQGRVVQRTRDGREIIVSCHKTLSRDRNAVLEVNRDVTLETKAEQALRESEKLAAMGRVAGMIAHEINNPLAAITNLFYLLQLNPSLDDEARGYAQSIEKELERVAQITRQTLGFYREARQPVLIALHQLVEDVLELQKPNLLSSKIAVQKRYVPASAVMGFPGELRQVFLNLISNAIQAMPNGGTLRLRVHDGIDVISGERGSVVSVIDTGSGIRKEDAKNLFQPFFSTKDVKGTGLGLWISKGILDKYQGHIRYRSCWLSAKAFTCFRVFIPHTLKAVPPPSRDASFGGQFPHPGNGNGGLSHSGAMVF